jgi:hypothetical protein
MPAMPFRGLLLYLASASRQLQELGLSAREFRPSYQVAASTAGELLTILPLNAGFQPDDSVRQVVWKGANLKMPIEASQDCFFSPGLMEQSGRIGTGPIAYKELPLR